WSGGPSTSTRKCKLELKNIYQAEEDQFPWGLELGGESGLTLTRQVRQQKQSEPPTSNPLAADTV
ncbi:hypothetical protein NDU88_003958, partial [Pleurodeles waltl]